MPIAPYAWGDAHSVAPSPMLSQHAEITGMPDGGFAVAWTSNYGSVQVIRYDAFGNAIDLTPITVASGGAVYIDVALAALPDGSLGVVWSQSSNSSPDNYDVWHAVIGPEGSFSADPALLGSPNANYQGVPEIAVMDAVQFMAVWQDNISTASGGSDVRGHIFLDYGATGGNSTVNPTPDASYQTNPQIAGLASDGVVIAWKTGGNILFRFDTGAGLSSVYAGPSGVLDFDVAGLSDGRIVFAYTIYDPSIGGYSVLARMYNPDGTMVGIFSGPMMATTGVTAQPNVDVTQTLDGGFMLIWSTSSIGPSEPDGEIFGCVFDSAGNSVNSAPFEIAPPDAGNETMPALATLSDGRIVALWGQESFYVSDLHVQIFNPNIAAAAGTAGNDGIGGTDGVDVIEGLGGNDQIGGYFGDDTLRGGAGLDYLHGGWGVDTLEGGGDADFLFGDFGADSHSGGGGSDWFVFDAGSNAGDAVSDYSAADRLLIVGSNAEPTFSAAGANVTVNGVVLTGAAAQDVTVYIQENSSFGHSASMASVTDLLANGATALGAFGAYSRFVFDADNNAVWRIIQDGMTSSNLLDFRWTWNDAGQTHVSTFTDFDQASANTWASKVNYYSAPGVLDVQWTYNDAGQTHAQLFTDWDQASANAWTYRINYYTAPGVLDYQWTYNDAGNPIHSFNTDWDQTSVATWNYRITYYSAPNVADYQWTYNDAGNPVHSIMHDWDQASAATWTTRTTYYSAANVADYQWTYHDAGQPWHSTYVDWDQANVETWAYHVINFSAPGVVANDYYV